MTKAICVHNTGGPEVCGRPELNPIGTMQGSLLPPTRGLIQAFPVNALREEVRLGPRGRPLLHQVDIRI